MAEIKNPEAYFSTMVRNSYKNEFRANDNFFNHISSVGDEDGIQQQSTERKNHMQQDAYSVEQQLCDTSIQNWLLFMENQQLHKALCILSIKDIAFLFALSRFEYNCKQFADNNRLSKQAVSKRFRRLKNKIKNYMQEGCPK